MAITVPITTTIPATPIRAEHVREEVLILLLLIATHLLHHPIMAEAVDPGVADHIAVVAEVPTVEAVEEAVAVEAVEAAAEAVPESDNQQDLLNYIYRCILVTQVQ